MFVFQAIILGIIQGLTEFLPISSSGHLALAEEIMAIQEPMIFFDTCLHLATLLALIIYFRKSPLLKQKKVWLYLILASLPAVIVVLLFEDIITWLFTSNKILSFTLFITALVNLLIDEKLFFYLRKKNFDQLGIGKSLIIGFFQALAILPGISRSGMSLLACLSGNLKKQLAFEFAFLMSIPTIIAAFIYQTYQLITTPQLSLNIHLTSYFIGGLIAFTVGLFSLRFLENLLKKASMKIFAIYLVFLSLLTHVFFVLL